MMGDIDMGHHWIDLVSTFFGSKMRGKKMGFFLLVCFLKRGGRNPKGILFAECYGDPELISENL